ncbi:MAG: hypothetical protein HY791_03230 [Deltaproteobacteria bacterium]|nr:hypothetical protein [Deltaproteobacteria bacterium]
MNDEVLDFSTPETTSAASVVSPTIEWTALLGCTVLFIVLIVSTARWALRHPGSPARSLGALSPAERVLALVFVISCLLIEALGATDAYVRTRVLHDSAGAYFQELSRARLLGISHAHLFGYVFLYGTLGVLISRCAAQRVMKVALVSVLLWSGVFDVVSWWGMRELSGRFEWLAVLTGMSTALCTALGAWFIARALFEGPDQKAA